MKQYKLITELISEYEKWNKKIIWLFDNIADWLLSYYSIDLPIKDIIKDIKNWKINKEHLINALWMDYEYNIRKLIIGLWIDYYFNGDDIIIELSNFPVFNKIEKEYNDEELYFLANKEIKKFEKEINTKYNLKLIINQYWRWWKHIWFPFLLDTDFVEIYEYLNDIISEYKKTENNFITKMNKND